MQLAVGEVIKGVYRVCEVKHGGMGDIYVCDVLVGGGYALAPLEPADLEARRGELPTSGRKAVLKSVSTDFYLSGGNRESFEREALIWTTLAPHPYVITCQAVDRLGSAPVIVLDYADGGNLRERLAIRRQQPVDEALRISRQVCVAMQYLASKGILHRDLKPENILFGESNEIKLTDFGLSSLNDYAMAGATDEPSAAEPVRARFIGGTLPYMSPEHFGAGDFTSASDIYSFGAIMFEMLEGRLLFDCASVEAYREAHLGESPPAVSEKLAPNELRDVVARCVEKDPHRRFGSFEALDAALAEIVSRHRLTVPQPLSPTVEELERDLPADVWTRRGYAFGMLRRNEESLRSYRRALELEPEAVGAHNNVGVALARLGRDEEALELYEQEVAIHPDVPILAARLGDAYAKRGRFREAAVQLETATRGDPTDLSFIRRLAAVYRQLGRDVDCDLQIARLVKTLADDPVIFRGPAWVNEGLHLGLMHEFEASLEVFEEVIVRYPELIDGWHNRAVTLLCLARPEEALASTRRALQLSPQAPQALFLDGLLCMIGGAVELGLATWQALVVAHPQHLFAERARFLGSVAQALPTDGFLRLIGTTMHVPNDLYYRG